MSIFNLNIYVFIITAAVILLNIVLLNIVLLRKLLGIFSGRSRKRFWLITALVSMEGSCYLIPYFAAGRIFYVQEIAAGVL